MDEKEKQKELAKKARSERWITKHYNVRYRARQYIYEYYRYCFPNMKEEDYETTKEQLRKVLLEQYDLAAHDFFSWRKVKEEEAKKQEAKRLRILQKTLENSPKKKIKIIIKKKG
jgi:hypothetical protein